jgi:hypothetical protein
MEALVILLAEFLTAFVVPAVILIAEIVAIVISMILDLAVWLIFRKPRAKPRAQTTSAGRLFRNWKAAIQRAAAIFHPIRKVATIGLALTIGAVVLLNGLLFEPTVRLALALVGQRTGAEVTFGSVSGNLLTGRFAFEDLHARRASDVKSNFDLRARTLQADLDLLTLIARPITFESLSADSVSGTFHRPQRRQGWRADQSQA